MGQPVPARLVADRMNVKPMSASHMLARARCDHLVEAVNGRGWVPTSPRTEWVAEGS